MKTCHHALTYIFHVILLASTASGQVGSCEPGTAEASLDIGNVRADIFNNGALFRNRGAPVYEVPKDAGLNAIYASIIWIAGKVDNNLRAAASRTGPREFWPGPLDKQGNPPADCSAYDQLWEVNRQDLLQLRQHGKISENIRNWPWTLGAPVIDGDGIPDNYNPEGGDLPELYGHQRIWWIMNDRGNAHLTTESEPIGIEVHASAFAFDNPPMLQDHTFYEYRLINKNTVPITDAYFTYWTDADLGNFDDDYVGSDSLLHLGYYYNADNDDEGGYGEAPPAVGFTFIKTPVADQDGVDNDRDGEIDEPGEMMGASSVMNHSKGHGIVGPPLVIADYYNYMRALWKDGSTIKEGWYHGNMDQIWPEPWPEELAPTSTRFSFSGDPVTASFWSENNIDKKGLAADPADRRLHTSSGPFSIAPGDTIHIAFAVLWARGDNNLDSVHKLKGNALHIRSVGTGFLSPSNPADLIPRTNDAEPANFVLAFNQNFPNPFSESTTFRYSLPQSMRMRLTVYDMLGREVELLVDQQQDAGNYTVDFEAGTLPSGMYLAQIELDHLRFTKRMVLAK
ncbi:MAG: T9SS type A sorting domain-containing protein [Rhodothermales bacterium]